MAISHCLDCWYFFSSLSTHFFPSALLHCSHFQMPGHTVALPPNPNKKGTWVKSAASAKRVRPSACPQEAQVRITRFPFKSTLLKSIYIQLNVPILNVQLEFQQMCTSVKWSSQLRFRTFHHTSATLMKIYCLKCVFTYVEGIVFCGVTHYICSIFCP